MSELESKPGKYPIFRKINFSCPSYPQPKFWSANTPQSIEFGVGKKEKKRKGPLVMGFNNKGSGILVVSMKVEFRFYPKLLYYNYHKGPRN